MVQVTRLTTIKEVLLICDCKQRSKFLKYDDSWICSNCHTVWIVSAAGDVSRKEAERDKPFDDITDILTHDHIQ